MKIFLHSYMAITSFLCLLKLFFLMETYPLSITVMFVIWINILLNIMFILDKKDNEPLEVYTVVMWFISIIILGK